MEIQEGDTNSGIDGVGTEPSDGSRSPPCISLETELLEAQRIAQVGSWLSDFQENVIRWSPEVYRIFGLSPNAWHATHEAFMSLVHPEDRGRVQAAVDAALAGDAYDIEHRILRPDGKIRIVRERGKVEFDGAGRPLQMIGTVHDITDRKWQEEELRRRELRFRLAQQAARFGIWEWELAEDRIHWDANCWIMLGYAPDTPGVLSYAQWRAMVHPDDLEDVDEQWRRQLAGNDRFTIEFRYECSHGGWAWVQGRGQVIEYDDEGQPQRLMGTHVDISQIKRAEQQAHQAQQRAKAYLNTAGVIMLTLGRNGIIEMANQRACSTLKCDARSIVGLDWFEQFVPERYRHDMRARFNAMMTNHILRLHESRMDSPILTRTGEKRWIRWTAVTLRDERGLPEAVLCSGEDITEQRHAWQEKEKIVQILEAAPDIVCSCDEHGRIHYMNRAGLAFWNLPDGLPQPGEPAPVSLQDLQPDWAIQRVLKEGFPAALQTGHWCVESAIINAQGEETPVHQTVVAHPPENGDALRFSTLIRDISLQKRYETELHRQAFEDTLTAIPNRRHFESVLEKELQRAERYGHPFSVMLLDVDHFKSLNDRFGHEVGDEVLYALAQRLDQCRRASDTLARWGGEEFIALLPEILLDQAIQAAEGMRRRIEDEPFKTVGRVTISLGVAQFFPGETMRDLIRRADQALYQAKSQGRNQVAGFFPGSPSPDSPCKGRG
ncbi:hypothetical protein M911_04160 [Ectothiorhodospira haloalkaliphila]|uniref:Diguanylate cyclase n=1 Tax=Ectothiorhodospira haloalkaliphila TaxID=421628 RepID=W8KH66_9GAMM|nr:diguanylate cyclase [Ectothiorhodospira haloalkaliphila]AHK78513.1 hypothetical protein M911_04160 [Ectothiorhodospira haloalkaliphila]